VTSRSSEPRTGKIRVWG